VRDDVVRLRQDHLALPARGAVVGDDPDEDLEHARRCRRRSFLRKKP
jgi:hypothetical protein